MSLSRRRFLTTAAVATLGFPALVRARNLNSRLQVAAVGCDGKGFDDIKEIGSHPAVRYVGFCDVDAGRFARADAAYPGVPHHADFRSMFAQLGDGFDAAIVSTPDHMHALPALTLIVSVPTDCPPDPNGESCERRSTSQVPARYSGSQNGMSSVSRVGRVSE